MFVKKTLEEYFQEAASGVEVPGGGSVSAVAATLGSCMASMAANFTAGKKKYAGVEAEIQEILRKLEQERAILQSCIDEDAQAFLKFNEVYAMPKDTDEQKAAREAKMQQTLHGALQPPMKILTSSLACMELLPKLAEIGNQNLISDTGVAALMLRAGIYGARLNAAINLKYIKDDAFCAETTAAISDTLIRADDLARLTLLAVEKAL